MNGLPVIIGGIFGVYQLLIFVYCILTFIPSVFNSAFGRMIAGVVQPFLNLISRIIPTRIGLIDFAPIIALVLVQVLEKVIFMII